MSPAARFSPQEQETIVLNAASKCISQSSLLDFKMSEIAKEAGLSMGSIYKHVQSKEDVLIALAVQSLKQIFHVFKQTLALPLTTPERVVAIYLFDYQKIMLNEFDSHLNMLVSNDAILRRASNMWLDKKNLIDQQLEQIFYQFFKYAIDNNEIEVDINSTKEVLLEEMLINIWSLHVGFNQVSLQRSSQTTGPSYQELPFPLPEDHAIILGVKRLLNSYQWQKPLDSQGIRKTCHLLQKINFR